MSVVTVFISLSRNNAGVYLVPVVYLPMDEAVGDVLQGSIVGTMTSGASLVAAQFNNGLYTDGVTGHVNYGNHYTECYHNPDMCPRGVTFAAWIKRGDGADYGVVFETGGEHYVSTGKGNKNGSIRAILLYERTWPRPICYQQTPCTCVRHSYIRHHSDVTMGAMVSRITNI